MVIISQQLRPAILLFGDSITQQGFGWEGTSVGWASLLARDYSRRADVWNRGYSGYTTQSALSVLPTLQQQKVLFSTIFFGANDAALPGELQHVPLETYAKNLETIIDHMRTNLSTYHKADKRESQDEVTSSSPQLPLILMTPPPVDVVAWYKERGPNCKANDRANDNAKMYGDMVKTVSNQKECSVLDVFDLLGGNGPVEEFSKHLRDGLHLSESGNVLVHEGLMKLIEEEYPHLAPMTKGQGIPLEGKPWRELC